MIRNWLQVFYFHVKKNKLFTILNISGLSIGIAGLIFAIMYWNDEHSYNAWNPEKEVVHQLISDVGDDNIWAYSISPLESYLKNSISGVDDYCYLYTWYNSDIISYNGKKEMINKITDAQSNFFTFFPFDFVHGTAANALPDNNSIALSKRAAERLFQDEDPIGKEVKYGDSNLVVRGVYEIPGNSSIQPEAVVNFIDSNLKQNKEQWGNYNFSLLLKIPNPEDKLAISEKIEELFLENKHKKEAKEEGMTLEEYFSKYNKTEISFEPLSKARLHSITNGYPEGKGNYQFLLIMMGLSLLILLLSIVNYINLATAGAIKRAKEVGVRKVIGATKRMVIFQFIFETVITSVFSILLALVLVEFTVPYYNEFLGKELVIHGNQFYFQLFLIFVVTILVAGIFPAIYVSNFKTLNVLKGNFGRSKKGVWMRNWMLILQFSIAALFVIGSYIVHQQVLYMSSKEVGFKGDQIIQVSYRRPSTNIFERYTTIKNELLKMDGVAEVSTGAFSFGNGANSSSSFNYNDQHIQGQNMAIDFGLLEMMDIGLLDGRTIDSKFSSDTINSVMINETARKMMLEDTPLGKKIDWNGNDLNIIGVVNDFHLYGPHVKIPPMVFFHVKTIDWMKYNLNRVYVKVEPENMDKTIAAIEDFWLKNVTPDYPFNFSFVNKNFERTYETYVKQKNLFSLLNIVVIIIALFGLFALVSYSMERRMKEIAIRKTLGAETPRLLKELSKQYVIFCVIGFVITLYPVFMLLTNWLENFAYRIDITTIPFIAGFIVLMILTLVVVLSRAYQATRVEVLNYLKYE